MKVETERLENCQMALTIEVEEKRAKRALRRVARRVSRQAKIPGFRPGKAPYNVVARYFGKEVLSKEVVDELGDTVYEDALEETGIKPFGQAQFTDYETNPLVIKVIVPLAPVVELGDYRQMRLEPEDAAAEEEVGEALRRIQEQNTFWEPVKRPAQWGDLAIVDIEGAVKGETIASNKGSELLLDTDSPTPLPGFSEELLGMTINEQREFTLTYPEEFENDYLAGQPAHFAVHLQDLKEKATPDIDDDLARTVGSYETLEDLKAELRRELQAKSEQEFSNRALTALVEGATMIEFPPIMLEKEIEDWLEKFDRSLKQQNLNLENYLAMRKLTEEEFLKEVSPQVEERLKRSLALGKLTELEGLEVEPDELVSKALERLTAIARGELEDDGLASHATDGLASHATDGLASHATDGLASHATVETSAGDSAEDVELSPVEASVEPLSRDEPSSEEPPSSEEEKEEEETEDTD